MVNLRRWQLGSPEFEGPPDEYQAPIINHEVGHWLGYGHRTCPGTGRPAPVMMQQIKGLHGCVSNAWPYGEDGTFHDGPRGGRDGGSRRARTATAGGYQYAPDTR